MRVLFTGSRHASLAVVEHRLAIWQALRDVDRQHPGPHTLVHGDADGADRIAKQAAGFLGWATDPHPADWNGPCRPECHPGHRRTARGRSYCPAAGNYRNQHMVDLGADLCIGTPLPGSRGTWDCLRRAEKAGILTLVVRLAAAA